MISNCIGGPSLGVVLFIYFSYWRYILSIISTCKLADFATIKESIVVYKTKGGGCWALSEISPCEGSVMLCVSLHCSYILELLYLPIVAL